MGDTFDVVVAAYQTSGSSTTCPATAYEDKAPYPFTGTVKKVVFDLRPATHEDEQALHEHAQAHGIGAGAAG